MGFAALNPSCETYKTAAWLTRAGEGACILA
jgi:hypothetical protein